MGASSDMPLGLRYRLRCVAWLVRRFRLDQPHGPRAFLLLILGCMSLYMALDSLHPYAFAQHAELVTSGIPMPACVRGLLWGVAGLLAIVAALSHHSRIMRWGYVLLVVMPSYQTFAHVAAGIVASEGYWGTVTILGHDAPGFIFTRLVWEPIAMGLGLWGLLTTLVYILGGPRPEPSAIRRRRERRRDVD